jgi:biopolymer transport protein ExbB
VDAALDAVRRWLASGGLVMGPLLGVTVAMWWALGYRLATLRRGRRGAVATLLQRAHAGALGRPRGLVDGAVARALAVVASLPDRLHLAHRLDIELWEFRERCGRYAVLARSLVAVAPLAGLLGTVTGMIEMFDSLGSQAMYSQDGGIAAGIAEALVTTEMGLAIAIPGLLVARLLERRADRLGTELTQVIELCSADAPRPAEVGA